MVRWLRLGTSDEGGMGLIPGQGTKIPHATWHGKEHQQKNCQRGTFLAVQLLGLCTFIAEGPGSIPGQGSKIPQAAQCRQKIKK